MPVTRICEHCSYEAFKKTRLIGGSINKIPPMETKDTMTFSVKYSHYVILNYKKVSSMWTLCSYAYGIIVRIMM